MKENNPVKILHFCWFGGNALPPETVEYMKSWKKFLPDFEIMRWDESNFDVNSVPFVKKAYEAKKWAFVSDYVRCYALYKYGGLYLDTDVQVVRKIDDLLVSSFLGFEHKDIVAPGLILYAKEPHTKLYEELLDIYSALDFEVDIMPQITSPVIFTGLLKSWGLKGDNSLQQVKDVTVYPMEYFNPIGDDITSQPKITENTRAIHWYNASWFNANDKILFNMRKKYGYKRGTLLFVLRHPIMAMRRKMNKNNKVTV